MDSAWQIIIGLGIASTLISIFQLYRSYLRESKKNGESQRMAKWSIFFGLSGIILIGLGSFVGMLLGLISLKGKKHKALSKIGVAVSVLTLLPWLLVFLLGS